MTETKLAASRRAVILGLAGTAAFAGTMGAAIASPAEAAANDDRALLAAWAEYQRLQRLNYSKEADAWTDAQSHQFYATLDAIEATIEKIEATTPQGAAAQVLLSLMHTEGSREFDQAVISGDLSRVLTHYADADWSIKLSLRAVMALQKMGA